MPYRANAYLLDTSVILWVYKYTKTDLFVGLPEVFFNVVFAF